MKRLMVVIAGTILSVFLFTAVNAAAPDSSAGAQQGQQGTKNGKAKQKKRVSSKRETAKSQVQQEAQKRRALIESERGAGN